MEPLVLLHPMPKNCNQDVIFTIEDTDLPCIFCDRVFLASADKQDWLTHLLQTHEFLIYEVDSIALLSRYVRYWTERFKTVSLPEVCITCQSQPPKTDGSLGDEAAAASTTQSTQELAELKQFYMLSPLTCTEDKVLRGQLRRQLLEYVLDQQQKEREDNSMIMSCLFCSSKITGNRSLILDHLKSEHNFNLGHPDNLVFAVKMLNQLHERLESLVCLYCEKIFKDRVTLKEHMRKKQHKRLNPTNKTYDKYYLINYLGLNKYKDAATDKKPRQQIKRGRSGVVVIITQADSDAEDESWNEEEIILTSQCLFCQYRQTSPSQVFSHMKTTHRFDMKLLKRENALNFYHQVKLINYIRRQMIEMKCIECQEKFSSSDELLGHMYSTEHITTFINHSHNWDQPEYFFPTYEDDNLLSGLDASDSVFIHTEEIIPEDAPRINVSEVADELKPLLNRVKSQHKTGSPLSDPVWSNSASR